MALYGVTGVHIDGRGRIARVRMQRADGALDRWIGQLGEYEAHEVANLIATGDDVHTIFIVPGGTVAGPKLPRVGYPGGAEGVELEEVVAGRSAQDLVPF